MLLKNVGYIRDCFNTKMSEISKFLRFLCKFIVIFVKNFQISINYILEQKNKMTNEKTWDL